MPTTYTETTVLETDSFVESFNEDLPIDVELFDNINGSLGLQRASQVDTSDAIALNLTTARLPSDLATRPEPPQVLMALTR